MFHAGTCTPHTSMYTVCVCTSSIAIHLDSSIRQRDFPQWRNLYKSGGQAMSTTVRQRLRHRQQQQQLTDIPAK
jgi:hypothetical protein